MPKHICDAISQKLELISSSVIYHWKAHDIYFKVDFFLRGPFSLAVHIHVHHECNPTDSKCTFVVPSPACCLIMTDVIYGPRSTV